MDDIETFLDNMIAILIFYSLINCQFQLFQNSINNKLIFLEYLLKTITQIE